MRKLRRDWLTEYLDYVSPASQSPPEFHTWAAATVLAASLKRNVYVDRGNFKLFPNLYTVFVGRPATGKGSAIDPIQELLKEANTANILADRITVEYALEKLSNGWPTTTINPNGISVGKDSSAIVFAPELSVFIRSGTDSLSDLTQLWDNRDAFDYGTRGKGLYHIDKPCFSMLGGTPPTWLIKSIPADAIGGGFTSRVNFVYTRNDPIMPSWAVSKNGKPRVGRDDLVHDLRHIAGLRGEFTATPAFASAFDIYTKGIKFEDFEDESTTSFKARKWVNTTKLAMVFSLSRSDSLVLDEPDWIKAVAMTEQVEADLGVVFRAVGESSESAAIAKVLEFLEKQGTGATLGNIMMSLWRHVSKDDAVKILNTLCEAGMVRERGGAGHRSVYMYNGPARFVKP